MLDSFAVRERYIKKQEINNYVVFRCRQKLRRPSFMIVVTVTTIIISSNAF